MFDSFTQKISGILNKIRGSGTLTAGDIDSALREIRVALLSADVSVDVAKKFIADVKEEALGEKVIKSLSPGQMVVKIVHDHLIRTLGGENEKGIDFSKNPTKIMLVGLQGAGKTTTAAKIASLFQKNYPKKTAIVGSVDLYRPAAIDQLRTLANQAKCSFFETDLSDSAKKNAKNFLDLAKKNVNDLVILDTAGRLQIDQEKMNEIKELEQVFNPDEILLVADIMTGQEAINIAKQFAETVKVTGIVLTRVDGDAKGGVALSMKAATGIPIKYLSIGEKLDQIEVFHPERIASRMLDMGDVMSLVEKAQATLNQEDLMSSTQKMLSGQFDLDDFADNLKKMSSLGGITGIVKYLPGFQGINEVMKDNKIDNSILTKNLAIISSMTKFERKHSSMINGSRRKRIADGSGTTVQDVNRLLKQFEGIQKVMKRLKNMQGKGNIMGLLRNFKGPK